MAIKADKGPPPAPRLPGDFARHPHTGAPWVDHPTKTKKRPGLKPALLDEAKRLGIELPDGKVTVAVLYDLLGPVPTRVMYGRPSSLGKQIENTTNLQKWSERAVALGIYLDPGVFSELRELDDDATDA